MVDLWAELKTLFLLFIFLGERGLVEMVTLKEKVLNLGA